jgi:hypothetical protein
MRIPFKCCVKIAAGNGPIRISKKENGVSTIIFRIESQATASSTILVTSSFSSHKHPF